MSASTEDLSANKKSILEFMSKAIESGCQIVCFPEMAMIGYGFEDLERRLLFQGELIQSLQKLVLSHSLTVLIGGLEQEDDNLFITQFIINEQIQTYRKIHVGRREGQYVSSGVSIPVFEANGLKFGVMICYDGHFPELATIEALQGAKIIFNPSASPNAPEYRIGMWQKYLTARAYDNRVWVAAANLRFKGKGGGMMVINSDGNILGSCKKDEDHMMIFDYTKSDYSSQAMRHRDFLKDRRQEVYDRYGTVH